MQALSGNIYSQHGAVHVSVLVLRTLPTTPEKAMDTLDRPYHICNDLTAVQLSNPCMYCHGLVQVRS